MSVACLPDVEEDEEMEDGWDSIIMKYVWFNSIFSHLMLQWMTAADEWHYAPIFFCLHYQPKYSWSKKHSP
jgi:hypothetical protein